MKTYEELKNMNDLKVVDWFNFQIAYPFRESRDAREMFEIIKETEKAVLITIGIESHDWEGTRNVWIPKKCFESYSEYQSKFDAKEERFLEGQKKYEELLAKAKELGVKGVRKLMRTDTIKRLAAEQGITL